MQCPWLPRPLFNLKFFPFYASPDCYYSTYFLLNLFEDGKHAVAPNLPILKFIQCVPKRAISVTSNCISSCSVSAPSSLLLCNDIHVWSRRNTPPVVKSRCSWFSSFVQIGRSVIGPKYDDWGVRRSKRSERASLVASDLYLLYE